MASAICISCNEWLCEIHSDFEDFRTESTDKHTYAIIAKGNIIEGIEAKE